MAAWSLAALCLGAAGAGGGCGGTAPATDGAMAVRDQSVPLPTPDLSVSPGRPDLSTLDGAADLSTLDGATDLLVLQAVDLALVEVDASPDLLTADCPPGSKRCFQNCVGVDDPNYGCGLTGCSACADRHYAANTCSQDVCSPGCAPGFADCDGDPNDGCEVDTTRDAKNCGQCGMVCALPNASAGCSGSACVIASCQVGFGDCNGAPGDGCEVDLTTTANCGACGNACSGNQVCAGGVCAAPKCSAVAAAWCTAKGWSVAAWKTSFPNAPGGAIYCVTGLAAARSDCDTCADYNEIVWKNTAVDACYSGEPLLAGSVYGGHSSCTCLPNLLSCGTWPMQGCTPD